MNEQTGTSGDHRDALFQAVVAAVLESPGELPNSVRKALAGGELTSMPDEGHAYLIKVEGRSNATTDDEVAALARLVGEEAVFEATIAVAVGAAQREIEAALALVEERD